MKTKPIKRIIRSRGGKASSNDDPMALMKAMALKMETARKAMNASQSEYNRLRKGLLAAMLASKTTKFKAVGMVAEGLQATLSVECYAKGGGYATYLDPALLKKKVTPAQFLECINVVKGRVVAVCGENIANQCEVTERVADGPKEVYVETLSTEEV